MAYDSQRGRTVLFGGNGSFNQLGDTWEWDGAAWMQMATAGPTPRAGHAMAYDSQWGRTVLFAGSDSGGNSTHISDTWAWDGSTWTQLVTSGPGDRRNHAMAYDTQRGKTVLFGGYYFVTTSAFLGDTWEFAPSAHFTSYGAGCNGSQFSVSTCAQLNPTGGTLAGTTAALEFGVVINPAATHIVSFDVFTQSTGGTQTIPAHIYSSYATTPLASTTMTVGPTPGFYTATFASPVPVNGALFVAIDTSAQTVVVPNLTSGATSVVLQRTPPAGSWTFSPIANRPAYRVTCRDYATPTIDHVGDPILGTSYDVTLSDALPQTTAIFFTGLSDAIFQSTVLPAPLPGAPGCDVLAAPDATMFVITSPTGTASYTLTVPNSTSYIGVELFHQWAVIDAANPLGLVVSNAGKAWLGT